MGAYDPHGRPIYHGVLSRGLFVCQRGQVRAQCLAGRQALGRCLARHTAHRCGCGMGSSNPELAEKPAPMQQALLACHTSAIPGVAMPAPEAPAPEFPFPPFRRLVPCTYQDSERDRLLQALEVRGHAQQQAEQVEALGGRGAAAPQRGTACAALRSPPCSAASRCPSRSPRCRRRPLRMRALLCWCAHILSQPQAHKSNSDLKNFPIQLLCSKQNTEREERPSGQYS